jgi:uncharacterized protein
MELGRIPTEEFAPFLVERFEGTDRAVESRAVASLLELTEGHPHATQELAYFLWEQTPRGAEVTEERLAAALDALLRAEDARFTFLWEEIAGVQRLVLQALAREAGRPYSMAYRSRHELPAATSVQTALRALERRELISGQKGEYRIVEPFLREWLNRPRAASLGILAGGGKSSAALRLSKGEET